jgi:hypothetical protein
MERLKGFYQVKRDGKWSIAEYIPAGSDCLDCPSGFWKWDGCHVGYEGFEVISDVRISLPDDPQELHVATQAMETVQNLAIAETAREGEFIQREFRFTDTQMLDYMERHQTLHKQVEIIYVVDGYWAQVTWDEVPLSPTYKAETYRGALDALMQGGDVFTPSGR